MNRVYIFRLNAENPPRTPRLYFRNRRLRCERAIVRKIHWLKSLAIFYCLVNAVSADQFGNFTYTDNGTSITITDYPAAAVGPIAIPASITDKPVTSIGTSAFDSCISLTGVTIPNSVTSIGNSAFSACNSLASVTIGNSVTTIGDRAFYSCYSLDSITIPSSVTSVGSQAFLFCRSLTSVTFSNSLTSIGSQAFSSCNSLISVTIPNSVTSIGNNAFADCTSLASVTISNGVTRIGNEAFWCCTSLTSITIPNSVTSIGWNAFLSCTSLKQAFFMGIAPVLSSNVFWGTASGFTVYFVDAEAGFTAPNWMGYQAFLAEPPQFTSTAPPVGGEVGTPYSHTCTATGIPAPTFAVTSGALPTGLTLSSAGVISGTPALRGIFTGTITASNRILSYIHQNFAINIRESHTVLASAGNGTITGGGSYLFDAIAILTVTPSPGYVFTTWSGDATGTANPLSILMNADKAITANFTHDTSDSDGDGLSNYDEAVTYGTNPVLPDTDGDGLTDSWEVGRGRFSVIAGTFTWAQARANAHARGGELACFPTVDRWNRAMESLGTGATDNFTGLWIGASDATTEATWTWLNGESFTFSNWATSRPSTATGNTLDYAEVSGGEGAELGKWYDRTDAFIRDGYILEVGYATDPMIADTDNDGLKDGAEQAAGTNPFLADTDGDGFLDGAEVEFGGNPLAAEGVPGFNARTVLDTSAGTIEFRFLSQHGMSYTLEASTDLVGWAPLEAGIAGTGGTISRTYSLSAAPARWFRAERE